MLRLLASMVAAFLVLLPPGRATAQGTGAPTTAALAWTRGPGAEGCIGVARLSLAVEDVFGRAVWVLPPSADRLVEGTVEALDDGPGFEARIRVLDAEGNGLGRRSLRSASPECARFGPAIVLAVALAVDPAGGFVDLPASTGTDQPDPGASLLATLAEEGASEAPSGAADEQGPSTTEPAAPAPGAPAASPTPGSGPALSVTLDGRVGLGVVPGVTGGVDAGLDVSWIDGLPARFDLALWWPRSANLPSASARFWVADAGLALCPTAATGAAQGWRVEVCAGFRAALTVAEGRGFQDGSRTVFVLPMPALGPRLVLDAGGLDLIVAGSLEVPLVRPVYRYLDPAGVDRVAWRTPPVRGSLSLGVAFR